MSRSRRRWRRQVRNAREAGLCGIGRSRGGWVDLGENSSNSEVGCVGGDDKWTQLVRHDGKLVVPETRTKSSPGLVLLGSADLVISATKIDLREEMVAGEAVKQIIRARHGITIFDRVVVQIAVVNTETKDVVLLAIEEDRGTPWGSTQFNEALAKQLLKLAVEFLGFGNRRAIRGTILNAIVGLELDVVLDITHGRNAVVGDGWWENIVILTKEGTNTRRQGRKKGVRFLGSGSVLKELKRQKKGSRGVGRRGRGVKASLHKVTEKEEEKEEEEVIEEEEEVENEDKEKEEEDEEGGEHNNDEEEGEEEVEDEEEGPRLCREVGRQGLISLELVDVIMGQGELALELSILCPGCKGGGEGAGVEEGGAVEINAKEVAGQDAMGPEEGGAGAETWEAEMAAEEGWDWGEDMQPMEETSVGPVAGGTNVKVTFDMAMNGTLACRFGIQTVQVPGSGRIAFFRAPAGPGPNSIVNMSITDTPSNSSSFVDFGKYFYHAPLSVNATLPSKGPILGGTRVTFRLAGSHGLNDSGVMPANIELNATCLFDDVTVLGAFFGAYEFLTEPSIVCTSPTSDVGRAYVQVSLNGQDYSATSAAATFMFMYVPEMDQDAVQNTSLLHERTTELPSDYPFPFYGADVSSFNMSEAEYQRNDPFVNEQCGCKVFSKIDLKSGYHQIEVDSADQHKIAFTICDRLYELTVMPFALTNAPSTFQTFIDKLFHEQIGLFVVVCLDDILILSKFMKEHMKHLEEVFTIRKRRQLRLNLEKYAVDEEDKPLYQALYQKEVAEEEKEEEAKRKTFVENLETIFKIVSTLLDANIKKDVVKYCLILGTNVEAVARGFLEVQAMQSRYPRIDLTEWLKVTLAAALENILFAQYKDPHAATIVRIQLDELKCKNWYDTMLKLQLHVDKLFKLQLHVDKLFATPGLELTAQSCLDVVKGTVPTHFTNRLGKDFFGHTDNFSLMKDVVSLEAGDLLTTASNKKTFVRGRFRGNSRLAALDLLEVEGEAKADDPTLGDDQE
ncbi:hypothetical protein CBR_g31359 [Chara braunii]|uniref:Reverse transcriptase domain-containing protein n=1 Tax=Chara braunii TaxID=69332 RepID=A0A388LF06_CHABU|nr:hypothetical protein CBR_g31359 [Chara braunii]|eukprot:GBG80803.1 hypothetical protein CBR_g31359 [Chara braunii]